MLFLEYQAASQNTIPYSFSLASFFLKKYLVLFIYLAELGLRVSLVAQW